MQREENQVMGPLRSIHLAQLCSPQDQSLNKGESNLSENTKGSSKNSEERLTTEKVVQSVVENQFFLENLSSLFKKNIHHLQKLNAALGRLSTLPLPFPKPSEYQYTLVVQTLPQYFIKNRKFDVEFTLVDRRGQIFTNHNILLVEARLHADKCHLPLPDSNFKYYPESCLCRGKGKLQRAEIGILSKRAQLSLVITTCEIKVNDHDGSISEKIKPLQISGIQVKSKNYKYIQKE